MFRLGPATAVRLKPDTTYVWRCSGDSDPSFIGDGMSVTAITPTLGVLGVLGVWRVAHLLHAENGPWDVVVRLRRALGTSVFGRAMDCFDCLSLWVALPFAALIAGTWRDTVLLWPALSAAARIVNRAVTRLQPAAAALYVEEPEERADVQLRQDTRERVDDAGDEIDSGGSGETAGAIRALVDHRV